MAWKSAGFESQGSTSRRGSGGEGHRRAQAPTVPSDERGMSAAAANNPSLSARSIACASFGYERKHDATIASTGNGRRRPWAPIRTFRLRRRERVTRQPHAYSPQTWTRPCRDELCDSARRVRRDSRCTKRGAPATGQPVREFESRPLRRINRNATPRLTKSGSP